MTGKVGTIVGLGNQVVGIAAGVAGTIVQVEHEHNLEQFEQTVAEPAGMIVLVVQMTELVGSRVVGYY